MTYDMHSALEEYTNHHSPLFANSGDPSPVMPVDRKNRYNTDYVMKYYRDHYNIPASKLNIGSPYYSRGWKDVDPDTGANGLYARGKGSPVGDLDSPANPAGINSFGRMKELEKTPGYVKYRDAVSRTPWLYNRDEKIMYTYEDEISAAERCEYVLKNGFGGIIVWEITTDTDDHLLTDIIHDRLGL
jgi:chitinase